MTPDPVCQNRKVTALKHLSPHTLKTTCRMRCHPPSYTPTDTDQKYTIEPNCVS